MNTKQIIFNIGETPIYSIGKSRPEPQNIAIGLISYPLDDMWIEVSENRFIELPPEIYHDYLINISCEHKIEVIHGHGVELFVCRMSRLILTSIFASCTAYLDNAQNQ